MAGTNHTALKEIARKMLVEMGFTNGEIYEEYEVGGERKKYRVDVAGIHQGKYQDEASKRVAIECGSTPGEKIVALNLFFDQVIILPYFTINTEIIERERELREESRRYELQVANLREEVETLQKEKNEHFKRQEIVRDMFHYSMELFGRVMSESELQDNYRKNFFNYYYDKEDQWVIDQIKQKLDSLTELTTKKIRALKQAQEQIEGLKRTEEAMLKANQMWEELEKNHAQNENQPN